MADCSCAACGGSVSVPGFTTPDLCDRCFEIARAYLVLSRRTEFRLYGRLPTVEDVAGLLDRQASPSLVTAIELPTYFDLVVAALEVK